MYIYVGGSKNLGARWAPDLKNRGAIWKIRGQWPLGPREFRALRIRSANIVIHSNDSEAKGHLSVNIDVRPTV